MEQHWQSSPYKPGSAPVQVANAGFTDPTTTRLNIKGIILWCA